MRDPRRIKKFCDELAEIWEKNVPDWRFGQFICNTFGNLGVDPFYPEEDDMIELLRNCFKKDLENSKNVHNVHD